MKSLIFVVLILFISSCGNTPKISDSGSIQTSSIEGTNAEIAIKKDGNGSILENGIIRKGVKDGTWTTYTEDQRIKTISSYVQGKLNGIHIELNKRGQMEYEAHYLNDEYHGRVARYSLGRPTQELNYKNGVLDGTFSEFSNRGKLKKRGSFKNGKQHGILEFFDDNEIIIMKYEYENGEKVSGGIVDQEGITN